MFLYNNFLLVIYQLLGMWLFMIKFPGFSVKGDCCSNLNIRSFILKGSSSHYVKKSCFILGSWLMSLSIFLLNAGFASSYFLFYGVRQRLLFCYNFSIFLWLIICCVQRRFIFSPSFTFWSSVVAFHQSLFLTTCFTKTPLLPRSILALLALIKHSVSTRKPKLRAKSLFTSTYNSGKSILIWGGAFKSFFILPILADFFTFSGFLNKTISFSACCLNELNFVVLKDFFFLADLSDMECSLSSYWGFWRIVIVQIFMI